MVRSFDVFDTLIGRRFVNNDIILEEIQNTLRIPNFVSQRKLADTGKRSIVDIYKSLIQSQVMSETVANAAMELEYSLELIHCFPIIENMKKVSHGDLLISDMYLSAPMILEMVRSAGLDKQVTIYQSNRDKHTGKLWEKLTNAGLLHLGDNRRSDYDVPISLGIKSELYRGTPFSDIEIEMSNNNFKNLALLMREVRLRLDHKYVTDDFLNAATQFNLPSLFILCELIKRKYPNKCIVFLGRDCQLLQKIYSVFYNNTKSTYLPFSRKIAFTDPTLAVEYIHTHCPADSVLFDLNSTGTTWNYLNNIKKLEVCVAVFLNNQQYLESSHTIPDTFSYITENNRIVTNVMVEILNTANHGTVSSLKKLSDGVIVAEYDSVDMPEEIVSDIQRPIYQSIELSKFYKERLQLELSTSSDETLIETYRGLVYSMSKMNKKLGPHIQQILDKERQHVKDLNTVLSNIENRK
jgi:hypothetical protein